MRTLELRPVSGRIGTEVVNPRREDLLADEDVRAELHRALLEHHLVVIRSLDPTPEEHVQLAAAFGDPIAPEDHLPKRDGHPMVCRFDSAVGYKADRWHTDGTFRDVIPSAAVLVMRTSPATGGDTAWSNCSAAYEDLSDGMKGLLEGRKALHDQGPDAKAVHPVVVAHPETGRPILFVNDIFTRGIMNLPPDESSAVLPFLIRHVGRPEFTYRHRWAEGDVVIWDNRSTQHYGLFDFEGQRVVERVHVAGGPMEAHRLDPDRGTAAAVTDGPW
ncbi:MAG: TauD/TfdA family dioxygenase [Acidimicrobiales bacterium]|jgi:taurine dioxygenase|nr:TauD/TfdA family dioxygenase [Acidimicrobiales bacterium]